MKILKVDRWALSLTYSSSYCWHGNASRYSMSEVEFRFWGGLAILFCPASCRLVHLTHWGRDKMATILQKTFSNAFPWMRMDEFRLKFHWNLFPMAQLKRWQHNTGSDNGLVQTRRQTIISTNDDPFLLKHKRHSQLNMTLNCLSTPNTSTRTRT